MRIPEPIRLHIAKKTGQVDNIGLSGSCVTVYDDCVLKTEPLRPQTLPEIPAMAWLSERLPVPRILCHEVADGYSFLLMTRMEGAMSCEPAFLETPQVLVDGLAAGLKLLWSADPTGCPRLRTLDNLLEEARYNVSHGLVDMEHIEPETFSPRGFADPEHLLQWLEAHKVPSEPVLAHGDYCLPNVFLKDGAFHGFIDIGDMGIGEKWRDIALCYRSLRDNLNGRYGGKCRDFDPCRLFDALGIRPDWEKIRYHLLLDELF